MKKPSGHLDICRRNIPGKGNSKVQMFEAKKRGGGLGEFEESCRRPGGWGWLSQEGSGS